jgi:hypothetical protein
MVFLSVFLFLFLFVLAFLVHPQRNEIYMYVYTYLYFVFSVSDCVSSLSGHSLRRFWLVAFSRIVYSGEGNVSAVRIS